MSETLYGGAVGGQAIFGHLKEKHRWNHPSFLSVLVTFSIHAFISNRFLGLFILRLE